MRKRHYGAKEGTGCARNETTHLASKVAEACKSLGDAQAYECCWRWYIQSIYFRSQKIAQDASPTLYGTFPTTAFDAT